MRRLSGPLLCLVVLLVSVGLVACLSVVTNETRGFGDFWDPDAYREVAANGLVGNKNLKGPFAFRPAAPLAIGGLARLTGWSVEDAFRFSARLMSVVLIVGCFLLAWRLGAEPGNALWIAAVLALNMWYVKWTLFSISMVDIYAYPVFLLAFYFLWQERYALCVAIAAVGLFFKEFLLLPILTTATLLVYTGWRRWRRLGAPLLAISAVLVVCFVLPRVLIPVVGSSQEIDPARPETLTRLVRLPLNPRRWFNILFCYIAIWLPVLMLLNRPRLVALRQRLAPRAPMLLIFAGLHLLLVLYGGTNIWVFVSYSLPLEILLLRYLLEDGQPHVAELVLVTIAVIIFNRSLSPIPTPEEGVARYLEYYGGFSDLVTSRSFTRLGEAFAFIAAALLLRRMVLPSNPAADRRVG